MSRTGKLGEEEAEAETALLETIPGTKARKRLNLAGSLRIICTKI